MSSWHSYPSIYALGHRYIADLFSDPVLVEEKIDGSQFSFGYFACGCSVLTGRTGIWGATNNSKCKDLGHFAAYLLIMR